MDVTRNADGTFDVRTEDGTLRGHIIPFDGKFQAVRNLNGSFSTLTRNAPTVDVARDVIVNNLP